MPGGYQALHDLAQFEWTEPSFLVIMSDTPFLGNQWAEPVPGTLHLVAWESTTGQLPMDSGVVVGSTFDQLQGAYPDLTVGSYDVCETEYLPARFLSRRLFMSCEGTSTGTGSWTSSRHSVTVERPSPSTGITVPPRDQRSNSSSGRVVSMEPTASSAPTP